jgi:basic amino acid/polyamine antiporter, APA family
MSVDHIVEKSVESGDLALIRAIRKWDLVAIALNGIIGAGIFGLPSRIYALTGTASILALVGCAAGVGLIVICFAEVSSRYNKSGGPYLYARQAFGPTIGFEVGWMLWLARLTSFAANCNLLVLYLTFFWPGVSTALPRALVITGVVSSLTIINLIGVRRATLVGNAFTIAKVFPLLLLVGVGLFFIRTQNFHSTINPGYRSFSTSILLLIYAFTGFETAVIPVGEVKNPRRDLPVALLVALSVVTVLYTLIQVVCIGTLPGLAESTKPLADAAVAFMGSVGGAIITAGAAISIMGNLSIIVLAAPRIPFAMAELAQLPRVLSAVHPRYKTPHISILVSGVIMLVLSLSGSFLQALTISTLARLFSYMATCAALPVLRRKADAPAALFKVPGGAVLSGLAVILSVWLLSTVSWDEGRNTIVAAAIGMLLYLGLRYSNRRQSSNGRLSIPD